MMMINLNWQPGMNLEIIEKSAILQAFRFYRGNKTATAQALGIAIRTLDHKLEKYATDDVVMRKADEERRKDREEFDLRQRGIPRTHQGTAIIAKEQAGFHEARGGLQLESIANTSEESGMPMPQRKEVQGLPSKQVVASNPKRTR